MVADIEAHGGAVETGARIGSLAELPPVRATLLDVAPPGLLQLADGRLPDRYRRALESFRFGNAACKVDFILSGPVPWAASGLADAGTVHVGGTRAEMATAENLVAAGQHPDRPYVLVSQPSRFDAGRAPGGRHILWSYCHVPAGSTVDMAGAVIAQLERFAPGFRDLVVSHHVTTAAELGEYNENYVGGDFSAGLMDLRGIIRRPVTGSGPLADSPARRVPVLLLHTPGPRGDRHAGIPRRKICLEGHIRPRDTAARNLGLAARLHGNPQAGTGLTGWGAESLPSRMVATESVSGTNPVSWVTMTVATPKSSVTRRSSRTMDSLRSWSRAAVGSSTSRTLGSPIRARAMLTRWRWPPESWWGRLSALGLSPTTSRSAAALARAALTGFPRRWSPMMSCSAAVRDGEQVGLLEDDADLLPAQRGEVLCRRARWRRCRR